MCKLFGVSLLTETQHGPWKREETDPTQEHMHVLYKKVYSLYIYLFITWCVLKFSTSEILGWKYKSGGKGLHSTLKNKKHNSLSFHITTEEAGLGHGDGRPFFHLESSRVTRKWEVQRVLGENTDHSLLSCLWFTKQELWQPTQLKKPGLLSRELRFFTHIWNSMALVSSKALEIFLWKK